MSTSMNLRRSARISALQAKAALQANTSKPAELQVVTPSKKQPANWYCGICDGCSDVRSICVSCYNCFSCGCECDSIVSCDCLDCYFDSINRAMDDHVSPEWATTQIEQDACWYADWFAHIDLTLGGCHTVKENIIAVVPLMKCLQEQLESLRFQIHVLDEAAVNKHLYNDNHVLERTHQHAVAIQGLLFMLEDTIERITDE